MVYDTVTQCLLRPNCSNEELTYSSRGRLTTELESLEGGQSARTLLVLDIDGVRLVWIGTLLVDA